MFYLNISEECEIVQFTYNFSEITALSILDVSKKYAGYSRSLEGEGILTIPISERKIFEIIIYSSNIGSTYDFKWSVSEVNVPPSIIGFPKPMNNEGNVNFQDAGLVWIHRTTEVDYNGIYDVNQDSQVNFQDAGLTWINRD